MKLAAGARETSADIHCICSTKSFWKSLIIIIQLTHIIILLIILLLIVVVVVVCIIIQIMINASAPRRSSGRA